MMENLLLQEGDEFVAAADAYVRKYVVRGIPSLFSGACHTHRHRPNSTGLCPSAFAFGATAVWEDPAMPCIC